MSAVLLEAPAASSTQRAEALAAELRQRFEAYNAEFTRITRRAAEHFHSRNWQAARADAVQRIELYDRHVGAAIDGLRRELGAAIHERDLWVGIKQHFELQITGVPDSDFYRTFLNSITRDVFVSCLDRWSAVPSLRRACAEDRAVWLAPRCRAKALLRMRLCDASSQYSYVEIDNALAPPARATTQIAGTIAQGGGAPGSCRQ